MVQGGPLSEVAPAPIEGRMFRRFLAQNVPQFAVMRINAPPPVEQNRNAIVIVGLAATMVMLVALGLWTKRRAVAPMSHVLSPMSAVEPLIAELATLDARFERNSATDQSLRDAYARERTELKDRIARALAAENPSA